MKKKEGKKQDGGFGRTERASMCAPQPCVLKKIIHLLANLANTNNSLSSVVWRKQVGERMYAEAKRKEMRFNIYFKGIVSRLPA